MPYQPSSIYAVSKVGEEMLALMYWKLYGMRVLRVRPFNVTGPRKTSDACSDFAKGIVEIQRGIRDSLEVGNLDTVRDFTDGRDAADALWKVATNGVAGDVYNISSGQACTIRSILEMLISLSGSDVKYRVGVTKLRPFDDPVYVGDNAKLRDLGWVPRIPLQRTLEDTLDYWRARVNANGV
jgi:GDP-4-dehydro-6-deoxy-D-mannose reductase